MNILLIYPNIVESPKDISIGLATLSAMLKEEGHTISLIDTTFGMSDEDIIKKAKDFQPKLIAMTTATNDYNYAKHIISLLKFIDVPMIVGGFHPTVAPQDTIKDFDFVCVGEGEEAIVEFADAIENNKDYTQIQNLWVKKGNEIIKNPVRPLIQDLDKLPLPDRSIYDYKKYLDWNHNTASFITTRGCPYMCTYCINHLQQKMYAGQGKFVRYRSVGNVIKEIKQVIEKYKPNNVEFYDDTFTLNKERMKEFCEEYSKEITIPFIVNARVNAVDKDIFEMLKKAGCIRVSIGIESGDPEIRNKILKRNMTDEQIINAFRWAKEAGLQTYSFNMIGVPGETKESIERTIKINQQIQPDYVGVSIFNACKGTELYNLCERDGLLIDEQAAESYFMSSNIKHPNFTLKQLIKIRNNFGFKVFFKFRKKRAIMDLVDRNLASVPHYTWLRSRLMDWFKLRERMDKI